MPESGEAGRVLIREGHERRARIPAPHIAWRWLGWLGLVLAVAGLTDLVLLWVPVRLGVPEWEFATVTSTASAMPLVSLGLAAMLASGASTGRRWLLRTVGTVVALGAIVLAALLVLFLTDVPMALQSTSGDARLGIVKATVRTVVLTGLFGVAYGVAAVWAFRLAAGKGTGG